MPKLRTLLVCVSFWTSCCLGADRLSIQLSGGYTEFTGPVAFGATFTPTFFNPFDPEEPFSLPPIETDVPVQYDTHDTSWEATVSYRFWQNLHLVGGYTDLGTFDSETMFIGFAGPFAPPMITAAEATLDATAWLLGAKLGHAATDRIDVYVRAAALRASFDLDSRFPPIFDLHEPDDRTGWTWGVGANYALLPRLSVGMAFGQYDVKLEKVDSYQLTVAFDLL